MSGRLKNVHYSTLDEASNAVRQLGIVNTREYEIRYKEDPKLPVKPHKLYTDWKSWHVFFGRNPVEKYSTLDDASIAAQKLYIATSREYRERYVEDPRLPSTPFQYFTGSWNGWNDFLNKDRNYQSLVEASKATIFLRIYTRKDYRVRYKENPQLPSAPDQYYKDVWNGWDSFFGRDAIEKYKTLDEASKAVHSLFINSHKEYRDRYKEDHRLPSAPNEFYQNEWNGWDKFFPQQTSASPFQHFQLWGNAVNHWLKESRNLDRKQKTICNFIIEFKETIPERPEVFLHRDTPFDTQRYERFILSAGDTLKRSNHSILIEFFDWVLEEYCVDKNDYEAVILPGYRNPLKTLLKGLLDALPSSNQRHQSTKPVLPLQYIEQARNFLFPAHAKSFKDVPHLPEIFRADWIEIDEKYLDKNDPDCVFRAKKSGFQVWCPARAVAVYTLLKTPIRGQQILWLDSGEGDKHIPFIDASGNIKWEKNTLPTANQQKSRQGFIQKTEGGEGMYITTNKTSKSLNGYFVPYISSDLAYWIIKLRQWQAKYNSLCILSKWTEIGLDRSVNKSILKARGSQAFLFRNPNSDSASPYRPQVVFKIYLPQILYEIEL